MNMQANVFVVDDDDAVREALATLLRASGHEVASYSRAEGFLAACAPDTWGCLVLDVGLPGMDGPKLQQELVRRNLNVQIIFLSGQGTIEIAAHAIRTGAMDFLTKPVEGSVLRERVNEALAQCRARQKHAREARTGDPRLAHLTEREREVMMLAIAGLTSKEIGMRLNISYRTVETHRTHLILKTGASNMVELAHLLANQEGMLSEG